MCYVNNNLSNSRKTVRTPMSITTGTNILKLDPGIYSYEDKNASDEQKLAMGFPKGMWHSEITVTGYWADNNKSTGYINIVVRDCNSDTPCIYENLHAWTEWKGWQSYALKSDLENVENKCNEDIELVVTKNSANINGGTIWGKRTGKTASIGFIDFIVETKVNMVQWTRYPLCTVDCNMTAAHSVLVNQENGTCYALEIDSGDKTIYIKVENTALTAGTWLRGQIVFMCWKDNAI